MLAAYAEEKNTNTGFTLLGVKSILGSARAVNNVVSLLDSPSNSDAGMDYCSFGGLFYEPSNSELLSFAESQESCGSIAYSSGSESCGSIGYSGSSESCGSIASASSSSSSCACSYSC